MPTPAVETDALVKRYPKVEALGGVSLAIEPGEIFALLGPNGAGKTTWISIVCGLTRATSGSARVLGHDVVSDAMAARRIVGPGAAGDQLRPLLLVARGAALPDGLLRRAAVGGAHRRAARGDGADGEGRRHLARAVGRHAAAPAHRQGAGAPAARRVPRRADRGRRRRAAHAICGATCASCATRARRSC